MEKNKPNFFKSKQRPYSKVLDLENPTIPETWIIYRKTVLKISQKQIASTLNMELALYCRIEKGHWKGIPLESWNFIFSQLIRDLCLLTKKDMKSLFPEFFCLENFSLVSQKEIQTQKTLPKDPLKDLIFQENSEALYKALKELTPEEEDIIKARFALGSYDEEGLLEEIATRLNLTRERVRQTEAKALWKLFQSPFLRTYFKVPKEYRSHRCYHKYAYDDGL